MGFYQQGIARECGSNRASHEPQAVSPTAPDTQRFCPSFGFSYVIGSKHRLRVQGLTSGGAPKQLRRILTQLITVRNLEESTSFNLKGNNQSKVKFKGKGLR